MGTNFYYKIPLKPREVQHLKNLIDEDVDLEKLQEEINTLAEDKKIHLGKRSHGWQFLWDYHKGKYYQDNLESIKDFLNNKDGYVINEYGDKFTPDEFIEDIKASLYKDKDHMDLREYQSHSENGPRLYKWWECEYQKNGLRFSLHENYG